MKAQRLFLRVVRKRYLCHISSLRAVFRPDCGSIQRRIAGELAQVANLHATLVCEQHTCGQYMVAPHSQKKNRLHGKQAGTATNRVEGFESSEESSHRLLKLTPKILKTASY